MGQTILENFNQIGRKSQEEIAFRFSPLPVFLHFSGKSAKIQAKIVRKTVKNKKKSENFFKSLDTIRIHVCVKFHDNWTIFGLKMDIFWYFLAPFPPLLLYRGNSQ